VRLIEIEEIEFSEPPVDPSTSVVFFTSSKCRTSHAARLLRWATVSVSRLLTTICAIEEITLSQGRGKAEQQKLQMLQTVRQNCRFCKSFQRLDHPRKRRKS
jgi:hypothetical protein